MEIELVYKRTLNGKHFDLGNGQYRFDAHAGHIHYFDKLDSGRFREIDHTLQWDEERRGWYFNYHSFRPFLPEYADDWVEFRDLFDGKDQTIKYKAQCEHIKGELVENIKGLTETNAVIYADAFGKGYDYIFYFTQTALKKVVRIREEFKKAESDLTFDFELELPKENNQELDVYRAYKKEDIAELSATTYKLDLTKEKTFDTDKQLLIGNDKADGREWFTYILPFIIWDSEKLQEKIDVKYYVQDDKRYLQKIVSKIFLDKSVGDVFTDTTTDFQSNSANKKIRKSGNNWTTVRGATSGDTPEDYGNNEAQATFISPNYYIDRLFATHNTAAIDDGATITSATYNITVQGKSASNPTLDLIIGNQASDTALVAGDYDAFTLTRLANSVAITGTGAFSFTLNADGLNNINKAGYSKFVIIDKKDFDNTTPSAYIYASIYCFSDGTPSNRPYLSVTYSTGQTVSVSDTLTLTPSITSLRGLLLAISDTLNLTEAIISLRGLITHVSDALSLTENISALRARMLSVSDSIGLTEAVSVAKTLMISVADTLNLSGNYTGLRNRIVSVADNLGLTDAINTARTWVISVIDNLSLTETFTGLRNRIVSVIDNFSLTEQVTVLRNAIVEAVVESKQFIIKLLRQSSYTIKQKARDFIIKLKI